MDKKSEVVANNTPDTGNTAGDTASSHDAALCVAL